jgi:hypothetical protein
MGRKKKKPSWIKLIIWGIPSLIVLLLWDNIKAFFNISPLKKMTGKPGLSAAAQVRQDFPDAQSVLTTLKKFNDSQGLPWGGGVIKSHMKWAKDRQENTSWPRVRYSKQIGFNPALATKHAKILGII